MACTCVAFWQWAASDQLLSQLWWGGWGWGSADITENWIPVALSLQVERLTLWLSSVLFWETRDGIIDVLHSLQVEGGRPERQKADRWIKIQRRASSWSRGDWSKSHHLLLDVQVHVSGKNTRLKSIWFRIHFNRSGAQMFFGGDCTLSVTAALLCLAFHSVIKLHICYSSASSSGDVL